MPIRLFTMTDPDVHDADPGVHDGPIRLFTMGRFPQRPEEGLRWGELALALARQLGASGQLRQAHALRSLASVHRARGAMTLAAQRLREALAVMEAEFGPEHPEVVDVRAELAELAAAGT